MIKLVITVSAEAGAYLGARANNYIIEKEINMEIRKIFVVGSGLMGSGIAQTAIQCGYEVILNDQSKAALERGVTGITKRLERLVEKGKMTAE